MKQIIDIPDELFNIFKKHGINAFDYFNEYDKDQIAIAITHGTSYNPSGDAISREALKSELTRLGWTEENGFKNRYVLDDIINNAQAVNTDVVADNIITAHENIGYEQGFNDGYAKCVTDNERPQGDCISREAVRSEIWKERVDKDEGCNSEYIRGLKTAIGFINNAQAVDRPKGEWINHRNDYGHNTADCSLCGKTMQWHDEDGDGIPRYCWYCGASMKGSEENG